MPVHGLVPTEESAELKRLRWENTKLPRANANLRTVSAFLAAELELVTRFIGSIRVTARGHCPAPPTHTPCGGRNLTEVP
jgi:hypothetical protein